MISLNQIPIGKKAIIKDINHPFLNIKFKEIGILEGKEVKILFKAAFNGPLAIDLGGWILSMRYEEASYIQIYEG